MDAFLRTFRVYCFNGTFGFFNCIDPKFIFLKNLSINSRLSCLAEIAFILYLLSISLVAPLFVTGGLAIYIAGLSSKVGTLSCF